MNYIGSKFKLLPFLKEEIIKVVGNDLSQKVFCDLFAGTGIVGRAFKKDVQKIISNDLEDYSFVLNKNYIYNHQELANKHDLIIYLNSLELIDNGFIYNNYCYGSGSGRLYFSDFNGKKIDTIRTKIKELQDSHQIDDETYYFLLSSLLESADKVANTATVYGAYLKKLKKSALKNMTLESACYEHTNNSHEVYKLDSNELIKIIHGDILYLDPPYNQRQYSANYHILNTIAIYDNFIPYGKTGMRKYNKSSYSKKLEVSQSFEELIKNAKFQFIFLSYNNEGLMTPEEIKTIMSKYGKYDLKIQEYKRFKADKNENRNHTATSTFEYLHILNKT